VSGPQRIVCLTEEPTEVLYQLGQQQRIVGISGFTVRPPQARREKPRVSAFTSANIDEILRLRPDFVVGFSDLQADIAAALIRAGVEVWISNHRSVAGILDYIRRLGALVGAAARADAWAMQLGAGLDAIAAQAARLPRRPRVYFEEWDEPRISGIQWVAELLRIAGGDDLFPERAPATPRARPVIRLQSHGKGLFEATAPSSSLVAMDAVRRRVAPASTSNRHSEWGTSGALIDGGSCHQARTTV